ncbi:hypothetical protein ACH42_03450 [Endozoicomonas sp. (ex Bugula neritina AB1)]|nr:hypothetical protein ACH42_03450 [Endozoicomonas sp. (ex Bugula neritina AB1)]
MSHAKKLMAGVVAVAVTAGAVLPGITGYILENNIQERLELSADKFNFSVSSVEINRSFNETVVDILLEGEGVRRLSHESLELSGSIQHNTIFSLPDLLLAELDFTYYTYQQGIQLGLPGSVLGTVSWNGSVKADIDTESLELPLDPMGTSTLLVAPTSGLLKVDGRSKGIALELNQLHWTVRDTNALVMSVSMEPSQVTISPSGDVWSMNIPSVSMSTTEGTKSSDLTLEEISVEGEQTSDQQMISSNVAISAGQLTVPALEPIKADKVIEGFTLSSSVENVTESSITQLASLMKEVDLLDNQEAVKKAAREFLVELSKGNPRFALDDFTLRTTNGDLGISFDAEGTDQSQSVLNTIINSQPLTPEQEDALSYQFMIGMNSSAKIVLSDDLVDWSCKRIGEQVAVEQGATAAEGELMGGMCKTMADSGDFLGVPCMEMTDSQQQTQCMETMNQVKVVWAESKTLEVVLKDGELTLNGTPLELPATL